MGNMQVSSLFHSTAYWKQKVAMAITKDTGNFHNMQNYPKGMRSNLKNLISVPCGGFDEGRDPPPGEVVF